MRSNLIWMQSLTSHMYALVTVNHMPSTALRTSLSLRYQGDGAKKNIHCAVEHRLNKYLPKHC